MSRNTKIVATFGPALRGPGRLADALAAGVDVVRLNLSHGDHEQHAEAIGLVRRIAADQGRVVAILLDLRGPKIRVGRLPRELELITGETVTVAVGAEIVGAIPIEGYPHLAEVVRAGEPILLDDGAIRLRIGKVDPPAINCRVEAGGRLASRKGVNLPETKLRTLETLTEKDRRDLHFALEQDVDWIALSFVRQAADVDALRELIRSGKRDIPIMAKIEKREALRDLEAIIGAADGVMVARGDLGVETELEEVTLRQKEIIRACNRCGKVVVTATQMLESMIDHPSPTRAEVADISNAIFDGTDALMLSGETAVGAHPIEAISFMARVAERTEAALDTGRALARRPFQQGVPDAVAHAACVLAHEIEADALICLTRSGLTARLVSRYRPRCPVIAVSPRAETVRRLAMLWGARPMHLDEDRDGEALVHGVLELARGSGQVRPGGRVVITAGVGSGSLEGQTNLVRVEEL
ncbi:MAG: pyruvate kinase [Candidatus Eisenbacteria sp.]|nr:pyruvate kinase [Candidatus Eisenbacteria bacterium]